MHTIHLKNIDLNLLLVFDCIYKEKSLTLAGERLGRTQSAMSHALDRLRTIFDDPLFVRTSRKMRPTPKADDLAVPIQNALNSLQTAFSSSDKFQPESLERVFCISMSDYCEAVILPRLMDYLWKNAPKVQIEILSPATINPQQGLESGTFELIVGSKDLGSGIYRQALWSDAFVCMVSSNHETIKEEISLEQYLSYPHVLFAPRGKKDRIVEETLKKKNYKRTVALRTPNIMVIPNIIKDSPYIITLPKKMAESIDNKDVKMFDPPIEFSELPIMQYWHEALHRDPVHKWLRKVIYGFFQSEINTNRG